MLQPAEILLAISYNCHHLEIALWLESVGGLYRLIVEFLLELHNMVILVILTSHLNTISLR
jgi:hypothetical protein